MLHYPHENDDPHAPQLQWLEDLVDLGLSATWYVVATAAEAAVYGVRYVLGFREP